MQYQQLGSSSLHISRLGFGCMSLKPGQEDFQKIIDAAIGRGINYFDTADLYDKGVNEEQLGNALKGKRESVIIATKAGNQWRSDGSGWDWNPRKEYLVKAVDQSLRRLQTDRIDLYQLHGGTIADPIDESIEAFETLVQQGKIRYYGISSIRPNVIREYVNRSRIIAVMLQYSLLDRRPEETVLHLLQENNIGVLARGTVASGLLVNKPAKTYLNYPADEVAKAAKAVKETGEEAATTAIRVVLQHTAITAAIVGIHTLQQLEEAVQAIEAPALSRETIKTLQLSLVPNLYLEHR